MLGSDKRSEGGTSDAERSEPIVVLPDVREERAKRELRVRIPNRAGLSELIHPLHKTLTHR